jgi:hypothetical protein
LRVADAAMPQARTVKPVKLVWSRITPSSRIARPDTNDHALNCKYAMDRRSRMSLDSGISASGR